MISAWHMECTVSHTSGPAKQTVKHHMRVSVIHILCNTTFYAREMSCGDLMMIFSLNVSVDPDQFLLPDLKWSLEQYHRFI